MSEKNNVNAITANLKTIGANDKSKILLNTSVTDYSNLSDALSGKKIKGDVKVDLDGDGIFDKEIKAKKLNKSYSEDSSVLTKVRDVGVNSKNIGDKIDQLTDDELLLNYSKGKSHGELKKDKNLILKDAHAAEISADKLGSTIGSRINSLTKKPGDLSKLPELQNLKEANPEGAVYVVQNGDTIKTIAKKLYQKEEEQKTFIEKLRSANPDEVRTYADNKTGKKKIEGFQVGHTIYLPGVSQEDANISFGQDRKSAKEAEKDYSKTVANMKKKGETVRNKEIDAPKGGDAKFKNANGEEVSITVKKSGDAKTYTEQVKDQSGAVVKETNYDEKGNSNIAKLTANNTKNRSVEFDESGNPKKVTVTKGKTKDEFYYSNGKIVNATKTINDQLRLSVRYNPNGSVLEINSDKDKKMYRIFQPDGNIIVAKRIGNSKFVIYTFDKDHKETFAATYDDEAKFNEKFAELRKNSDFKEL